jgi:hypothetical protein
MAGVPVPGYQAFWEEKRASLQEYHPSLIKKYPDSDAQYRQLFNVLCHIESLASFTPSAVGNSPEWQAVVSSAEENRANYCKALSGKTLLNAMYGTYTVALQELKSVLKSSSSKAGNSSTQQGTKQTAKEEGFQEVRKRKRYSSNEAAKTSKKPVVTALTAVVTTTPKAVPTKNFFAPLRVATMATEPYSVEESLQEEASGSRTGRPPPIVITAATNLLQLKKAVKRVVKDKFESRSTRNGTRVITKTLADFAAVKFYLESQSLSYFTFFPKSQKPIKAVIRHLLINCPAQDISEGLIDLGFDIMSVKQMTTIHRSQSKGTETRNLPLYLIALPRMAKSQEVFKLTAHCHIAIQVEAYRAQNGLTQGHNCQQFGHVWANCRQPPRCLWCGGGHLHKECPEKDNAASTLACCNCKLLEGENPIRRTIEAAGMRRRSCRRTHREHQNLQQEGCSPQLALHQVSPSLWLCEAAHRKSSSNKNLNFH